MRGRIKSMTKRILAALAIIIVLLAFAAWWILHGSLPRLDGSLALPGLSRPVTIARDVNGVVTIDAANESDAMRALGYVHAQERYFEMDLMRRSAAGELAALVGPAAVDIDKEHRVHRLRARTQAAIDSVAQGDDKPVLDAYVAGVNAGLADLRLRPWPYVLLRQTPAPWTAVDTVLAGDAMYFDLQDGDGARELALSRIRQHVPDALFALLAHDGSKWDAPLQGDARGDAVLPDATTLDLRTLPMPAKPRAFVSTEKPFVGSNDFAVDGSLTADGRAIVADDMHLGLRVPDIWFRVRLRYADARAPGGKVDASGFSLPGMPAVVVGSTGHIAWGFTNAYADTSDWQRAPKSVAVQVHHERIDVAGHAPITFDVRETHWGPVLHADKDGHLWSLRWVAQLPGALNLGLMDFLHAKNRDDALAIADHIGIPLQNMVIADAEGRTAWRLLGAFPAHGDDNCPISKDVVDGSDCKPWAIDSHLPTQVPVISKDRLWTANARTLDGAALAAAGDGGYDLGARAKQIRDDLTAKNRFSEKDLHAIQLDDRSLFLQPWWQFLQEQSKRTPTPAMQSLAKAATPWNERATADAVAYRIVRAWRQAVLARITDGLTAPAQAALGDDFIMPRLPQLESVAWPLVTQQPANLLPRRYASWPLLFEDAARDVRDGLSARGALADRTWGEFNTAAICHPLAKAIPLIGKRMLCMPADPLAGDSNMPRVTAPAFGASERMVVSPGHEADGIIEMPGGQSGNPLSPYWGAGHEDWVQGRGTPFLPGTTRYTLQLTPAH